MSRTELYNDDLLSDAADYGYTLARSNRTKKKAPLRKVKAEEPEEKVRTPRRLRDALSDAGSA